MGMQYTVPRSVSEGLGQIVRFPGGIEVGLSTEDRIKRWMNEEWLWGKNKWWVAGGIVAWLFGGRRR